MTVLWIQLLRLLLAFVFSLCVLCENDTCSCVPHYLCYYNGTIITDGFGIIDSRAPAACSCECQSEFEVCCLSKKSKNHNSSILPFPTSDRVTDIGVDMDKKYNSIKPCGLANPDGVGFKMGSEKEDVAFGEFPWMISISVDKSYRCGGSLIHPRVVLTAAHCVVKNVLYVARAGEWDSSTTAEIFKHQDREVSSIKIHENYHPSVSYNDIALLFLDKPFELANHIQMVCLPSNEVVQEVEDCYATGWGKNKFGGDGKYPAILKKILLPILSHAKCQNDLKNTNLGEYFELHKTFVCAGGKKGQDTCIGDGGGPLMCPLPDNENRYQLVGITSWGIKCNEEDIPGVYTNVAVLKPWIDKQMSQMNLSTALYQLS